MFRNCGVSMREAAWYLRCRMKAYDDLEQSCTCGSHQSMHKSKHYNLNDSLITGHHPGKNVTLTCALRARVLAEEKQSRACWPCLNTHEAVCMRAALFKHHCNEFSIIEGGNLERDEKPRCRRCNVESGRRLRKNVGSLFASWRFPNLVQGCCCCSWLRGEILKEMKSQGVRDAM